MLKKKGISEFFPIQYKTFVFVLHAKDLIGRAQTGSGKTIAYALPVITRFRKQKVLFRQFTSPKYLIVLPTRELTIQVSTEIASLKINPKEFSVLSVYGGAPIREQIHELEVGVDIIAATPGRLLDLLRRGVVPL
jgi:superfamily II DNA/RNA helicase